MDRSHKLRLRKETLTELNVDELSLIVGADPSDPEPTPPIWALSRVCPTNYCVPLTDACPTVLC